MTSDNRYEIRFRRNGEGMTAYGSDSSDLEATMDRARRIADEPGVRNVRVYRLRTVRTLVERVKPAAPDARLPEPSADSSQ